MARPRGRPPIDLHVKAVIKRIACEDKKAPRKDVAARVREELSRSEWPVPGLSTLMNEISGARRSPTKPIDEQWSFGSMVNHPIPPEALPMVVEMWRRWPHLTIREALWVGRLMTLAASLSKEQGCGMMRPLFVWAMIYAAEEEACDVAKVPCDTRTLDRLVVRVWDTDRLKNEWDEEIEGTVARVDNNLLKEGEELSAIAMQIGWIVSHSPISPSRGRMT